MGGSFLLLLLSAAHHGVFQEQLQGNLEGGKRTNSDFELPCHPWIKIICFREAEAPSACVAFRGRDSTKLCSSLPVKLLKAPEVWDFEVPYPDPFNPGKPVVEVPKKPPPRPESRAEEEGEDKMDED